MSDRIRIAGSVSQMIVSYYDASAGYYDATGGYFVDTPTDPRLTTPRGPEE